MSALRWWAEKIDKQNVIAKSNDAYGIAERVHVTNVSKAKTLDADQLAQVSDPYTAMSLRLEAAFGLRREESIKLMPSWADAGDVLRLKESWTKGGKYREVPIRTAEQRALLAEAKQLAGNGSLIPAELRYRDQLQRFKSQCAQAGIHGVHGLRHQYAQTRYENLTGWKSPGRWRADLEATDAGTKGDRQPSAADHFTGNGSPPHPDYCGLLWAVDCYVHRCGYVPYVQGVSVGSLYIKFHDRSPGGHRRRPLRGDRSWIHPGFGPHPTERLISLLHTPWGSWRSFATADDR